MVSMANTYYDIGKFALWGDVQADGSKPRLAIGFRDGMPRFRVYLGKDKGVLEYAQDHTGFLGMMFDLEIISDAPSGTFEEYDALKETYKDNKKTGETYIGSSIKIGKTKDGILFILLTVTDKEKIPFFLRPNNWHEYRNSNKEKREVADISKSYGKAFAYIVKHVVADAISQYTRDNYNAGEYKPFKIEPYDPNKPKGNFGKNFGGNKPSTSEGTITMKDGFSDDVDYF